MRKIYLRSFFIEIIKNHKVIKIFQTEEYENKRLTKIIDTFKNKVVKIQTVMTRAPPIMETLTGFMIAGFIVFSGTLISSGELGVNNFFSFLAAMMLAYQPIRSLATLNMVAYQGAAAFKRIAEVIDKNILVKENEQLLELKIRNSDIKFENINFKYDSTEEKAIKNINLEVKQGEIVVIVGPNGAGKSTAMKALLGMLKLTDGDVSFAEDDISFMLPQDRVNLGIAFVPQTQNVFTGMSVEENLEMGGFIRSDDIRLTIEDIYNLFPVLKEKRNQNAGELSGGQRQQVAFGRALMTKPKILMLDEPTAGVSPIVMDELFSRIIEVGKTGVGILMVEQNAKQALNIADRGYVLVNGMNSREGSGQDLLNNPEVRKSFLGG